MSLIFALFMSQHGAAAGKAAAYFCTWATGEITIATDLPEVSVIKNVDGVEITLANQSRFHTIVTVNKQDYMADCRMVHN